MKKAYQNPIVKKQRDELLKEYRVKWSEFEKTEFFTPYDLLMAMEPIAYLDDQIQALNKILGE